VEIKINRRNKSMKSKIILSGHGYFERRKKDGTKIDSWEIHNLIVTTGKVEVSKLINGIDIVPFDTIAIGEGETADVVVVEDTILKSEVARSVASLSYEATAKAVFEYTFTFGTGESYTITEAGIFNNQSAGGDMLDRFIFAGKSVDIDTELYCKITITIS
jgi:hypothetical protein